MAARGRKESQRMIDVMEAVRFIGNELEGSNTEDILHGEVAFFPSDELCCQYGSQGKTFPVMGRMNDLDIIDG